MENKNTGKNEFDLAKFVTGLTVCAFMLGILYPFIYYWFFNFNVFNYMELGEITTHVIQDGVTILLPYLTIYMFGFAYSKDREVKNVSISNKTYKFFRWIFVAGVTSLIGFNIYNYISKTISLPMFLFQLFLLSSSYLFGLPDAIRVRLIARGAIVNSFDFTLSWILVLVCYGAISHGLLHADSVKYSHTTKGTYILINKKDTIKSSETYYYIGSTNKYTFFYNEKSRIVDIYPEREIDKTSLR